MLDVASNVGNLVSACTARLKRSPAPEQPVHVLVVDDDDAVRTYVERVLRDTGYKTTIARSGPEALGVAAGMDVLDLLVTDVMMPDMNGDELARRLRQNEPRLKVLYLTGYSDYLFKEKVTLWADEAFLDKPCSVSAIRQAVSLILTGSLDQTAERAS